MKKRITMILALCMMLQIFVPLSVNAEAEKPVIFNDITEIDWYFDSVNEVVDSGLMKGTSETTFSPDMTLSRAMVATILYRMAGEPDMSDMLNGPNSYFVFEDVPKDEWYSSAVIWAADKDVVKGRGNNMFDPMADVSRAELATMIFRYIGLKKLSIETDDNTDLSFCDGDSIPEYARLSVQYLSLGGVINGKDNNRFDSEAHATRAEAAALFSRLSEKATVQDFSMLNDLGVSIKANAEIYDGSAFGGAYGYDFSVVLGSDENVYKSEDFKISVNLTSSTDSVSLDLLGESNNGKYYYSVSDKFELIQLCFAEGERIWAEITVSYGEETSTYNLFPTVRTVW